MGRVTEKQILCREEGSEEVREVPNWRTISGCYHTLEQCIGFWTSQDFLFNQLYEQAQCPRDRHLHLGGDIPCIPVIGEHAIATGNRYSQTGCFSSVQPLPQPHVYLTLRRPQVEDR